MRDSHAVVHIFALIGTAVATLVASNLAVATDDVRCEAAVLLTQDDGGAPPAGTIVRILGAAAGTVSTILEPGASAVSFADLACEEVTVEAGQFTGLPVPDGFPRSNFWAWVSASATLMPGSQTQVPLTIPARYPVEVQVVDREGNPAPYGRVYARRARTLQSQIGNRGFLGVPSADGFVRSFLEPGAYRLEWRHMGHVFGIPSTPHTTGREYAASGGTLEVADGPATATIVVGNWARLEGRVVDADGAGVRRVALFGKDLTSGSVLGQALSRDDGSFSLGVRELPVRVVPVHFERDLAFEPASLELTEVPADPIVFTARESSGPKLRGKVVRASSGEPVPGVQVRIEPECPNGEIPEGMNFAQVLPTVLYTGPDGRFSARCTPECPMLAEAGGNAGTAKKSLPVDSCNDELTLELEGRDRSIHGTVTDRKGEPLEGLQVWVTRALRQGDEDVPSQQFLPAGGCPTDSAGKFVVERLGEGRYRMEVGRKQPDPAFEQLVLEARRGPIEERYPVEVVLDERSGDPELELRAVEGGDVCLSTVEENGEPVRNGPVNVFTPEGRLVGWVETRNPRPEDDNHRLCVEHVLPGEYLLYVGRHFGSFVPVWWPGEEDRAQALPVKVRAGEAAEVGPLVVRLAGHVKAVLPGWDFETLGIPTFELQSVTEEVNEEEEPPDWEMFSPERTKRFPEPDYTLFAVPLGTYRIRACPGEIACKGASEIWTADESVEVRLPPARPHVELAPPEKAPGPR